MAKASNASSQDRADHAIIPGDAEAVQRVVAGTERVESWDGRLDAWRERVAIVRFCSGCVLTDTQAQRIVQRQMGLSDDEAAEMARQDSATEL